MSLFSLEYPISKFIPAPLPPQDSFAGQTVLVTGGTGAGLGAAAAAHFLHLGAAEVIITARNAASDRAEQSRRDILAAATSARGNKPAGVVSIMQLDMTSYESVIALAATLRGRTPPLDVAVLNAGASRDRYVASPSTGVEESVQVNALSTSLLGLLLVDLMRGKRTTAPRLVFVGSGRHMMCDTKSWGSYVAKDGGVIAHFAKRENFESGIANPMYANSKLLLQYAIRELCTLALDGSGKPEVIITTVCPGPVKTELMRDAEESIVKRLSVPVFMNMIAKSPDYGSRVYLLGALATPEQHGKFKFLREYVSDSQYQAASKKLFLSSDGQKLQAQVWKEIKETLAEKVPAAREILQGSKA